MHIGILSYRLGGPDGVSVVARSWADALTTLGHDVTTVAGAGPVDRLVGGLDLDDRPLDGAGLRSALADLDVVVVENVCSLPIKPEASTGVAAELRGRPAVLHHHDLPWQRARLAHVSGFPPDDPAWRHVVINELTRDQLARRGVASRVVYAATDPDPPAGDRDTTRRRLGAAPTEPVLVHPVRAIARKDVPRAVAIAEAVRGHYWLLGPSEEGYEAELAAVLEAASCTVHRGRRGSVADAYAAADVVLLPSRWEGFGLPVIEAAAHGRPVVVGRYPVAEELRRAGLRWLEPDDLEAIAAAARRPDPEMIAHNRDVVRRHFSPARLAADLADVLASR